MKTFDEQIIALANEIFGSRNIEFNCSVEYDKARQAHITVSVQYNYFEFCEMFLDYDELKNCDSETHYIAYRNYEFMLCGVDVLDEYFYAGVRMMFQSAAESIQ